MSNGRPQAQGFLLLTLDAVHLSTPTTTHTGTLAVECVTLRLGAEGRDVWLVLRLDGFEMPVSPSQVVLHARATQTFTFTSPTAGEVRIKIPAPSQPPEADDLETFEVLLAQYAALQEVESGLDVGSGDIKNRLVLVDERDGEVVGMLGEEYRIRGDERMMEKGHEKDPVMFELPEDGQGEVRVELVPPDQQDFITKTGNVLSRGIVYATDALTSGMTAASSFYIAHSTPRDKPIVFSETSKERVKKVHAISGKAVVVTAKTTGLIHEAIGHAVDYVAGRTPGSRSRTPASGMASPVSSFTSATGYASPSTMSMSSVASTLPRKLDEKGGPTQPQTPTPTPPPLPPRKPLANRLLLSTDLILTTLESSAKQLVEHGTTSLGRALGHKYGADVEAATLDVGGTVRNVGVVYVDARGVGRRALLKTAGKKFVRAKLGRNEVVLGMDAAGHASAVEVGDSVAGAPPPLPPRSPSPAPGWGADVKSNEGFGTGLGAPVGPGVSEKGKATPPLPPRAPPTPVSMPMRSSPHPKPNPNSPQGSSRPGGLGMGTNVGKSGFAEGW